MGRSAVRRQRGPAQILLAVALIRVATASANLILKGAGQHRWLSLTNGATAMVNVMLSIALIRPFGLLGAALGTVIPVTASAMLVCTRQRAGGWAQRLSAAEPGVLARNMACHNHDRGLKALGRTAPSGLVAGGVHLAVTGAVYTGLFLGVAIGAEERRFYWTKVRSS